MFTGLIQDIGIVQAITQQDGSVALKIGAPRMDLAREKIGASIACSGCCLTVTEKGNDWFNVVVSHETLDKTAIGAWKIGDLINLEPSLRLGDELGGHLVYGHIDGLAKLTRIKVDGDSYRLTIEPPLNLMCFIAPKGSIALDGISLTVNEVDQSTFGVNIIPHTWLHTNLSHRKEGDHLHIEIDMLARYVARLKDTAS
jgi:riboflavin synthase